MSDKYYFDTSIWIDLYEDRKGFRNQPIGFHAIKLLMKIRRNQNKLVISDILLIELQRYYTSPEILSMMRPFESIRINIHSTKQQRLEARNIAYTRNIPFGDALHSILTRDYNLIFISRDNDFKKLADIAAFYKPEDLI